MSSVECTCRFCSNFWVHGPVTYCPKCMGTDIEVDWDEQYSSEHCSFEGEQDDYDKEAPSVEL